MSRVRCQVSGVRCQVSGVRCQASGWGGMPPPSPHHISPISVLYLTFRWAWKLGPSENFGPSDCQKRKIKKNQKMGTKRVARAALELRVDPQRARDRVRVDSRVPGGRNGQETPENPKIRGPSGAIPPIMPNHTHHTRGCLAGLSEGLL